MHDLNGDENPPTLGAFGYFSALVLCCILVGGLTYSMGRENARRYDTPAHYAKAAKADAENACAAREKTAAFECIYEKVEAAQEQARGEQDLSAQQKAANASLISAIVAFFTFILSGIGVWFVKRTLDATLVAVKDTGKATDAMVHQNHLAEHAQRPWIEIDLEYDFGSRRKGGFILAFNVIVRNIGQTPARNANITHFLAPTFRNPKDEMIEIADAGFTGSEIYQSKLIILPKGTSQDQELIFLDHDVELHPFDDGVTPQIMVNVWYDLPNGNKAQTSAWFEVGSKSRGDGKPGLIPWNGPHHLTDVLVVHRGYLRVT